jgi:DNA-binding CsgD family transcriptional regulator
LIWIKFHAALPPGLRFAPCLCTITGQTKIRLVPRIYAEDSPAAVAGSHIRDRPATAFGPLVSSPGTGSFSEPNKLKIIDITSHESSAFVEASQMATSLRKTGLSVLGDMPWGTHFCVFYETKEDLLDMLVPFFKAGLESNEFCLGVISKDTPLTKQDAWSALRQAVPNLEQHAAAGHIEFLSHDEWFLQGGDFDIAGVIRLLNGKVVQALARGQAGMRVNGSPAWLQRERWNDFHAFEEAADEAIAGQHIIAACNFPLATSGAAEILAAARPHHFAVLRRNGVWTKLQTTEAPTTTHSLTPREVEVLTWAARGKSAWEIGEILHISKRTVDEHVQAAVRKLDAANRTQAVAIALLHRMIEAEA